MTSSKSSARVGRRLVPIIAVLVAFAGLAVAGGPAGAAVSVETPRIAGADRYATSAEVSEATFPAGSARVVIASGSSFADGFAAAALAGDLDAPVLLVPAGGPLPTSITSELTRLGATSARIVGGQAAVSAAVASELGARGLAVSRTGGADRYDTAALVARRVGAASIGVLDGLRTAFLATGTTFPDALAASAPAFSGVHPILLTAPGSLSPAAAAAIRNLGIQQVVIMGGTAAVSPAVENSVERTGVVVSTTRIAGADRGATARELADLLVEARPDGFGYGTTQAVITSGVAFPDALAAGPLAGRAEAPILFASPTTDAAASYLRDHRATITTLTVVGGLAAVTASQVSVLDEAATLPSNQSFVVTPSSAQVLPSVPYSAASPASYVQYVARDIPGSVSRVSIALADPAKVAVAANGTVTFTKAAGTPVRADLTNARVGDLKVRAVDGSAPVGGAATAVANVSVGSDRSVSFGVGVSAVTGIGEAVPVVFEAKSGVLPVGTDGSPTTAFAIGGEVGALPAEQPAPSGASVSVWSVGTDRFIGATSASSGRLFHLRTGDDYRIGGVGGTSTTNRSAFLATLSQGDAVTVQYNQRLGTTPFVANVFNITDDVVAAPTNLSVTTRDADSNGSIDTVRLTFTAPRTGLQTTNAVTVRRYPVMSGVVGTTPTDVVTSWAYTSGTTGQVDLANANFPAIGSYVYQVAVKGVTGTSFSPFSALSNVVQITSTGLDTVPSAPVATAIARSDSGNNGVSIGDVITVTFNEPMQITSTTRWISLMDQQGHQTTLQSQPGGTTNATFSVGGVDGNILTITVTGPPIPSTPSVEYGTNSTTTVIQAASATFKDRQAIPATWIPLNALGAGVDPLGEWRVPSSTPGVPFTLTADISGRSTGTITLNHVTDTIVGAAGAAVPGATVFVSAVGGTGGTAADAVTATRKQATAAANGSFSLVLSSATKDTTVQLRQEIQRTATTALTSATSAMIFAQPALVATSSLGGNVNGKMEAGDTIVLDFSAAMPTTPAPSFHVTVSDAASSVIVIKEAPADVDALATITTTGARYTSDGLTFATSSGTWSAETRLTITLGMGTGTTIAVDDPHTSSYVAGPQLVDANGVAIDTTPVVGASSRF